MKTRIKKPTKLVLESLAQLEESLSNIVILTAELQRAEGMMNMAIDAIRSEHEGWINTTKSTIEIEVAAIEDYAKAHPELFGRKKSAEFLHGTIGYRTGNLKLKTIRGWTWAKVKAVLTSAYIRVTEEVNKEALIADRKQLGDDGLQAFGVKVVQEESFFVEPKLENL